MLRSFNSFEEVGASQIREYGCWCYLGTEQTNKGKSNPVNEVDQICKNLQNGYECAEIDGNLEGAPCNPRTMNFEKPTINFLTQQDLDLQDITDSCETANGVNTCASRTCIIEFTFLMDYFNYYLASLSGGYDFQLTAYQHTA